MNLHTTVHPGFGAHLTRWREEAGLGLRELARRLKGSASYLSRLETGSETHPPSEEWIRAWADAVLLARIMSPSAGRGMPTPARLAEDTCWMARRIPASIVEALTDTPEAPVLVERVAELRNALLRLYRVHVPATAEDRMSHQVDPNGWSLVLNGTLSDAAKVLGIDREAEARAMGPAWAALCERVDGGGE